jgi:hypothetical protein
VHSAANAQMRAPQPCLQGLGYSKVPVTPKQRCHAAARYTILHNALWPAWPICTSASLTKSAFPAQCTLYHAFLRKVLCKHRQLFMRCTGMCVLRFMRAELNKHALLCNSHHMELCSACCHHLLLPGSLGPPVVLPAAGLAAGVAAVAGVAGVVTGVAGVVVGAWTGLVGAVVLPEVGCMALLDGVAVFPAGVAVFPASCCTGNSTGAALVADESLSPSLASSLPLLSPRGWWLPE